MNGKYLRDAEALLGKRDYYQASEKFWGAAAGIVKAVAARRERHLKTHSDLWRFVIELDKRNPGMGLVDSFGAASHLHSNFYEEELDPEVLRALGKSVNSFVEKLRTFL